MPSSYGEMFSSLGYDALEVILGINLKSLSEIEKRELVRLVRLSEKDKEVQNDIQGIMEKNIDSMTKKNMLLSLLVK